MSVRITHTTCGLVAERQLTCESSARISSLTPYASNSCLIDWMTSSMTWRYTPGSKEHPVISLRFLTTKRLVCSSPLSYSTSLSSFSASSVGGHNRLSIVTCPSGSGWWETSLLLYLNALRVRLANSNSAPTFLRFPRTDRSLVGSHECHTLTQENDLACDTAEFRSRYIREHPMIAVKLYIFSKVLICGCVLV